MPLLAAPPCSGKPQLELSWNSSVRAGAVAQITPLGSDALTRTKAPDAWGYRVADVVIYTSPPRVVQKSDSVGLVELSVALKLENAGEVAFSSDRSHSAR